MAVRTIPLKQDPDTTYKVTLDGQSYDIRVRYNQRETNVATGNPIKADEFEILIGLTGRTPSIKTPLKTNRDILRQHRYKDDCPKGVLVLRDNSADRSRSEGGLYDPDRVGFDTLGTRYVLVYIEEVTLTTGVL